MKRFFFGEEVGVGGTGHGHGKVMGQTLKRPHL